MSDSFANNVTFELFVPSAPVTIWEASNLSSELNLFTIPVIFTSSFVFSLIPVGLSHFYVCSFHTEPDKAAMKAFNVNPADLTPPNIPLAQFISPE